MDDKAELIVKINNFIILFTGIFTEALPWIVLGAFLAGVLDEFLPQRLVARFMPKNRFLAIAMGGLLGLIFPMCECGIIPVMKRLLKKGMPLSFCVSYLLAGPILNVIVLGNTYRAFWARQDIVMPGQEQIQIPGWLMMVTRAGLGFVVACTTAAVVEWVTRGREQEVLKDVKLPTHPDPDAPEVEQELVKKPFGQRLGRVTETALHDFIDITVFLSLGALLAATVQFFLKPEDIARLTSENPAAPVLTILIMMGLAIVLCLCSEADAFFAATFLTMPPAAKVAFLVLGPMLDLKLFAMYTSIFRPKLIWTIISAVVIQVLIYSVIFHYVWVEKAPPPKKPGEGPPATSTKPQ